MRAVASIPPPAAIGQMMRTTCTGQLCARTARGQAATAPARATKSLRLMSSLIGAITRREYHRHVLPNNNFLLAQVCDRDFLLRAHLSNVPPPTVDEDHIPLTKL